MTNVFSLDSLRKEVDDEYTPFTISLKDGTEVSLRSILRLNEKTRTAVLDAVSSMRGDDADVDTVSAAAAKVIDLVADANGKLLVKELGGDIAVLIHIIKKWMETTQLGEAPNSPDSSTDTASS